MTGRLALSDAAIERMLARRARRADPGDLAQVVLGAIRRTPARPARPWDGLAPRLAPGSLRWAWVAIAALLALALASGLLVGGVSRLLQRPYPILTGTPGLGWMSPVSGEELWTLGDGEGLWHFVDDSWHGPISPPPLDGGMVGGLAVGRDGAVWVSGGTTVAVFADGAWREAWKAAWSGGGLGALVVTPDGTVWVAQGSDLVRLRPEGVGYSARTVTCPRNIARIAATTDGFVYVSGFWYAGGEGLARSDGVTCAFVDPLGDGRVHQVADLSAGPAGSLLATVFDEECAGRGNEDGTPCLARSWTALLQDGRWATISGPTVGLGISLGQALAPDGHPWRIDGDRGLQRYDGAAWGMVDASARLGALAMAPDGVLWYAVDGGIARIRTYEVR